MAQVVYNNRSWYCCENQESAYMMCSSSKSYKFMYKAVLTVAVLRFKIPISI